MSDDKPGSLWQPVSPGTATGKVTDVTPDPVTSSSTTVASSAATVKPSAATSSSVPPRLPPSDRNPSPQPPSQPPRRGGLGALVTAIVLGAALLGALYALAPHWLPALMQRAGVNQASATPPASPSAPVVAGMSDADKQKLDAQFADLNARLATLKNAGPERSGDQGLADQVKKLQAEIQQLARNQATLNDRIGQLKAGQASDAGKPMADPAINERLDALQKQVDAATATSADTKNLHGNIDTLIAELAKATEHNTKLEQRLAELEKSVATRQNGDQRSVDAARASAVMSLAARLRSNVDAGRPFANDLAALKPLTDGDADLGAALGALEPLSTGGDSIAALRQSFPVVARAVVAAGKNDAADGWLDKVVARLGSIVSVRRVGSDVQGDSVEAHVARAEDALNNGKLGAAVAELKPITGNAAKAVAPWLAKAERQLAAGSAADKLQAVAAQRLAALQAPR